MKENTDKTTQNMKRVMRATGRERERVGGKKSGEKDESDEKCKTAYTNSTLIQTIIFAVIILNFLSYIACQVTVTIYSAI